MKNKRSLGPVTLAYPLPAFLVGSYDLDGRPNIMTAAWGGICSSEPPCLSVSVRESRWTHHGIIKNKAFTVSIPNAGLVAETDYAGIMPGKKDDKFTATGLIPVRSDLVEAPYVEQCPVIIELSLYKTVELGSHTQFIGQIMDVKVNENCFQTGQNKPDMEKINPLIFDPAGHYRSIGKIIGAAFSIGMALKK